MKMILINYIYIGYSLRKTFGILALILSLVGSAGAATWTVDDSGGANFTRIQDAIDNASAGDTILVYSGTYYENVNVNKQLFLKSIDNGGDKPIVDAGGSGSAITLSAGNTMLEGFEVVNSSFVKAGIDVKSNDNIIKNNNAKSNNYFGIHLSYSSNNNTLIGNNASNNDHGIDLGSSSNNTLTNNVMMGNKYNFGGYDSKIGNDIDTSNLVDGKPIYYIVNATNTVYGPSINAGTLYCLNCVNITIKDMNLNTNGAGIFFWNTSRSSIQNVNVSYNYFGIYLQHSSNNTIIQNNASINIVGIELDYSNNNTLSNNNAIKGSMGIYLFSSNNNLLNGNYATYNSAGLSMYNSSNNTIRGNNFSYNYEGIRMYGNGPWINTNNTLLYNIVSHNTWNGIVLLGSPNNTIYNNFFNNTNNSGFSLFFKYANKWNINKTPGTNIIGGPHLGGNFWANPNGTGFSQTCVDSDGDGICDSPFTLNSINIDFLPLTSITPPIPVPTLTPLGIVILFGLIGILAALSYQRGN